MFVHRCFVVLVCALFTVSLPLVAQDPRGTLLGRVADTTGAIVPSVQVQATNNATGVSAQAQTNESGRYTMPYLLPGFYRVTAQLTGFKRFVQDGAEVRVGEITELVIGLEVGQITESVEVTATTPLLDTTSPSLGQVIDQRRIRHQSSRPQAGVQQRKLANIDRRQRHLQQRISN